MYTLKLMLPTLVLITLMIEIIWNMSPIEPYWLQAVFGFVFGLVTGIVGRKLGLKWANYNQKEN